jgi:hypothetical protein
MTERAAAVLHSGASVSGARGETSQMKQIDPIGDPHWGTALSTACKGYQSSRLEVVRSEIWPNGPPAGLHVSARNRLVAECFTAKGWAPPSDRQLQRLHGGR